MKLTLSALFLLGLTAFAGAQVGPTLSIQSGSMQTAANGTKTIKGLKLIVNGVEIRADEATVAATDAVLELRGNVTVTIPQGWGAVPTR